MIINAVVRIEPFRWMKPYLNSIDMSGFIMNIKAAIK